jgi:hypothetical protein
MQNAGDDLQQVRGRSRLHRLTESFGITALVAGTMANLICAASVGVLLP